MTQTKERPIGRWVVAGIALVFGGLTILSGGTMLFGGPDAQAVAGDAVPFVLWFNFLSGFLYVLIGAAILLRKVWAATLALALAMAIVAVFAMFGLHIMGGGAYEMRTVGAMTLRALIWIGIAAFLLWPRSRA